MSGVLLDLDGVFYQGEKSITGAADVVDWLNKQNIPHLFLTNTSSRPRTAIVDKLSCFGIHTSIQQILTPPVATVRWLEENIPTKKIALFIPKATQVEFENITISDDENDNSIAAIIVGDLGKDWDFSTLNKAFRMLMHKHKPQLIALGMTRYWQADDGLRLDVAPFITALAYASDTSPLVMGKPANIFYKTALNILGIPANQTIMIGDDIQSDVGGAQQAGMRGVLVRTGKFRETDLDQSIKPDGILNSIRDFPLWWEQSMSI